MKRKGFNVIVGGILGLALGLGWSMPALAEGDPLPSWNATPTKQAIVEFVGRVTNPAALILSRRPSVSRRSTTMARSGLNSQCMSNWHLRSIG
jgi:hypothetical protein